MSHTSFALLQNSKTRLFPGNRHGGFFIYLLLLTFIGFSCKKEPDFNLPMVFTSAVTDIHEEGAVFNLKISGYKSSHTVEFGFAWDEKPIFSIDNVETFLIREPARNGVFSQQISTTLKEGVKYYVRAIVKDKDIVIFGQELSFISLGSKAPVIDDFWPKTGNLGDTLTITGNNFSTIPENNTVIIGDFPCSIVSTKQDTLRVLVPEDLNSLTSFISVSILENTVSSGEPFSLIAPVINDFTPSGGYGDQVIISGDNFTANKKSLEVYFDNFKSTIITIQDQSLTVSIPQKLDVKQSTIKVKMNNMEVSFSEFFQLTPFSIYDFTPKAAYTGKYITITGKGFSWDYATNKVYIGGVKAKVIYAYRDSLVVRITPQDTVIYNSRNAVVHFDFCGDTIQFSETLLLKNSWLRLKNTPIPFTSFPDSPNYQAHTFVHNGKAYIGLAGIKDFWEYDPSNDSWTPLPKFPGVGRSGAVGFSLGGKIYFGTGKGTGPYLLDWWEYDIENKTWLQKNDFPFGSKFHASAFSFGQYGYMVGGGTSNILRYSADDDSWASVAHYPGGGTRHTISVVNSTHAFIGLGNVYPEENSKRMYKFSMSDYSWKRIADVPYARHNNSPIGFTIDEVVYVKTNFSLDLYSYHESSNSWTDLGSFRNIKDGIAFSIDGKGYAGLGYRNELWEYDPFYEKH